MLPNRIHVFGASGSGTSTIASAISAAHGHRHLDTDDFLPEMRSRAMHEAWLAGLPAPAIRLDGDRPVDEQVKRIDAALRQMEGRTHER